ncbi:MAG: DNA internalization-related competence protein ComEC/Rec2 [Syntrophomonadaceae bacterium]
MNKAWFRSFIVFAMAVALSYHRFWGFSAALALLLLLWAAFKKEQAQAALSCLMVLAAGFAYTELTISHPPVDDSTNNGRISGTIVSRPRLADGRCSFVLNNDKHEPYQEQLQVFCYFNINVQKYQRVVLQGEMRRPDRPGNPGEFDYAAYLEYEQIYYIFTVKNPDDLKIAGAGDDWTGVLEGYRARSTAMIKNVLPKDTAGIFCGMLLGDVSGIDQDEYQEYQKTGIVHVFSVSGMHVGFLALLCSVLFKRMGFSKRVVLVGSLAILWLYATLVDWPAPVVRSVVMAALALTALYAGRENDLLNSLGLSGLIILLHQPTALFQISFQLSFLAAWGLVYLYPRWRKALPDKGRWIDWLLIPLAAQAAVLPLIAYYFNILSPISLLANLLLSYLAELVVMLGFLFLLLGVLITPLGVLMLQLAEVLINSIRVGNHLILQLPGSYLWVAAPGLAAICAFYLGIFLLTRESGSKGIRWGFICIGVFFAVICLPASFINRGQMEAVFLDVGQGDCILLKTPKGKFILIDGGGSALSDVGGRKVLPYLRHRGIRQLYWVVNTHPDVDHLAGLQRVANEFPVETVCVPASLAGADVYSDWRNALSSRGVAWKGLASGQVLNEGAWSLEVLYSGKETIDKEYNNHSLALVCRMGDFSALLTGDLDEEVLNRLDKEGKLKQATVLKLPHHGSKYSLYPPLYRKTHPRYGVISVGKRNIFGHPSPLVLQALQDEAVEVLRTDQVGAVTFRSEGHSLEVLTGPRQTPPKRGF